jgi:S1-C subfamily serine protease
MLGSVVKVLSVSDEPDYEQPWQTKGPQGSTGSGAVIRTQRGLRVLTNAHVVQNQVYVEVKRHGRAEKYPATVEGVGHECDLAILNVTDRDFFRRAEPLPLGRLPALSARVSVLGYPIGGERLSVTQGVLSRIEMTPYSQSQTVLLAGQIDAAINSGNSGGPVVRGDKLVGIAFESLEEGQNIGYIIPVPVVRHFLQDMANGVFEGFPNLGVSVQSLESPAHRRALGIGYRHGVLVTSVAYGSSAWSLLARKDVLLEVDGVHVAADGTVAYRRNARVDYRYVVTRRHVGETINVKIWREGRRRDVVIPLGPPAYLVSEDRYDVKPSYYLFGGLLFVPLTRDYLKTWGSQWWQDAPHSLLHHYESGVRSSKRHEVVILQKVLADSVNRGYHQFESLEIVKVQGKPLRNLKDLIRIVERSRAEFVTFESSQGAQIVLSRAEARVRSEAILNRFGVPEDRSPDLRAAAAQ